MTESCAAMTAPRFASIASSQSAKNPSGASATPSRDNSSYATTLRMFKPPLDVDLAASTARAAKTHRWDHHASPARGRLSTVLPVKLRLLLTAAVLLLVPSAHAAGPSVDARAYLVEDGRTGEVLLAGNPARRVPIASLTKMMTVLVTLEKTH